MNTELEHLRKMRELLANGWTQDTLAQDKTGEPVWPTNPDAVCFCIVGSTNRACSLPSTKVKIFNLLARVLAHQADGRTDITYFNDMPGRTQAEILAVVDRAIEIAEAEQ